MSLVLHLHPLSSYCMKALIAFYENETLFEARLVDYGDPASAAAFKAIWPLAKIPVLRDEARGRTIPETSIMIEYLMQHFPGEAKLIPTDPDLALRTRLEDRFYDFYVMTPMQKMVADRRRSDDEKDPAGVAEAKALLETAYGMIDADMAAKTWAMGEAFTLADCAAAPALFYANKVAPLGEAHAVTARYLQRLVERPSFARVLKEAEPYFKYFPQ